MKTSFSVFKDKGCAAFTLLEVMMALALFFSAVTFFSMAYLNTLEAMRSVQVNQDFEQDMATIRHRALLLGDVEEVEAGGRVVTGRHGTAYWRAHYEPTDVADLFRVTLTVELDPQEEDGATEAEQSFYLMRPTWSDPLDRDELRALSAQRQQERQTLRMGGQTR